MSIGRLTGIAVLLATVGLGYRLCFHPDDFPRQVRAALDGRRLSLLLGADRRSYDACYAAQFRGDECARWRLAAAPDPEYWPDPGLPPVRWPVPATPRVCQPGMDRREYFDAVCSSEAGEFITRTVEAEGI